MVRGIMFSKLIEAASSNHLVRQLLGHKRCFGGLSKMGIVTSSGEVDYCGTMTELANLGHICSDFNWMDPFLIEIRTVYEIPFDDFIVIPSKYSDGGPPCPWDIAKREQESARIRATANRNRLVVFNKTRQTFGRIWYVQ